MTDAVPAAVTYIGLPVSSGGAHSLGRMSRRAAYDRTKAFLQTCTRPIAPIAYSFAVYTRFELPPVPKLERELKRRFGDYSNLQEARVPEALDFLDKIGPQPTNQYGLAPIWFRMTSAFHILDPATGTPVPGQDPNRYRNVAYDRDLPLGKSGLTLSIHNQPVLSINLCIPDASDRLLGRLIPWVQENLPCKLSPKHWRAWTPTKSGSYKSRVVVPSRWSSVLRVVT